ncbi:hypothetical protein ABID65_003281 [Bradyrhizobium sp. S3.9.2]
MTSPDIRQATLCQPDNHRPRSVPQSQTTSVWPACMAETPMAKRKKRSTSDRVLWMMLVKLLGEIVLAAIERWP